ncbi:hypothetical protein [Paenibacillus elgii]|uniref:hypothetical protein n=1 Tax=Paenibacillus elgii TaxID=189691 RepID=UPI0013D4F984|nr:hypothetical protein [Paenibacillus elgii]
MKLIATREVLETFKIVGIDIPIANEILNTCIKLYQQDAFYSEDDLGSSISSGGVIISIFNLLGYDKNSLDKITTLKNRNNWLQLINTKLLDSLDQGNLSYFYT